MADDEFAKLQPGDLVRHKGSGDAYIVIMTFGERASAVRTADLTNPIEWDLVERPGRSR